MLDGWTVGCELELGDVDTRITIPEDLGRWDDKDGSVANTNGTANDPKKILNRYGGEIQVAPTTSTADLLDRVVKIYNLFPKKAFNFTTNFHVHVGVPGLKNDLKALKRIAEYLQDYGKQMFELVDPVPRPEGDLGSPEYQGAKRRYRRRLRSHHHLVSRDTFNRLMDAKTPDEFRAAHVPKDERGVPQWQFHCRDGVNLCSLWMNGTVEFRCYTMSSKWYRMHSAVNWSVAFLQAALDANARRGPNLLLAHGAYVFQEFWPYSYEQDKIFQLTNVYHNTRARAAANYRKLIRDGVIRAEELK